MALNQVLHDPANWVALLSLSLHLLYLKGRTRMPLNLTTIEQAIGWIAANPVVIKEGEDAAKLALDLIVGNTASVAPDLKQAVLDANFPAPWGEILSSDEVVDGIAAFFVNKAKATNAAALQTVHPQS